MRFKTTILATVSILILSGCARDNQIDVSGGVGITTTRSSCPAVAVPDYTGDVTLFSVPGNTNANAIDVVANITNVRTVCSNDGQKIYSNASFDVHARRSNPSGARSVTLPYFSTVVRAGTAVVSKRLGSVTVNFANGSYRGTTQGKAAAYVDMAAATLPEDIRQRITRKRKAGDTDAALDPLADPQVKAAIQRTSFELLIGFQLTADQLKYNATR